jgi:hypothetical protein
MAPRYRLLPTLPGNQAKRRAGTHRWPRRKTQRGLKHYRGLPATHQAEISAITASYRLGPARLGGNWPRPEDGCRAARAWWAARSRADSDIGKSVRVLSAALAASPPRAWDGAWVMAAFIRCAAERAAVAWVACCWAWRNSATAATSAARFAISAAVSRRVSSAASPAMASSRAAARRRSPHGCGAGSGREPRGRPGRSRPPRTAGPGCARHAPRYAACRPPPTRRRPLQSDGCRRKWRMCSAARADWRDACR